MRAEPGLKALQTHPRCGAAVAEHVTPPVDALPVPLEVRAEGDGTGPRRNHRAGSQAADRSDEAGHGVADDDRAASAESLTDLRQDLGAVREEEQPAHRPHDDLRRLRVSLGVEQPTGIGHERRDIDAGGPDPRPRCGAHGTEPSGIRLKAKAGAPDVDGDDHFAMPAVKPATICLVARRKRTMSGTVVMTRPAKIAE